MPIYEFTCNACDRRFEVLVRGEMAVRCPACGGKDVERRFSSFAVGRGGTPRPAPGGA